MGQTAKRRGERGRFWKRLIREQRDSGASIKAFCRSQGVSEPSFFAWRKKLALTNRAEAHDDFVAVRVTPEPVSRSGQIEIVLERGRSVRVEPGFDRRVLRDVLAVLEEQPC
jgi:transposase-like protein